jgi:hypothetical protein
MPQTIETAVHHELLIKKSRFIACVQPMPIAPVRRNRGGIMGTASRRRPRLLGIISRRPISGSR